MPDSNLDDKDVQTADNSPPLQFMHLGDTQLITNIPDHFIKTMMQFYGFTCLLHRCHDYARCMFIKGWQRYNPSKALPCSENQFALVCLSFSLFASGLTVHRICS